MDFFITKKYNTHQHAPNARDSPNSEIRASNGNTYFKAKKITDSLPGEHLAKRDSRAFCRPIKLPKQHNGHRQEGRQCRAVHSHKPI